MGDVAEILLADADVLIDYVSAEKAVLGFVSREIGPLKVLREVLATVDGLSERDCRGLRIEVIAVSTEELLAAGTERGALSYEDRLSLQTCVDRGWTCVSNDRTLLRECEAAAVPTRRGLSLLLHLVSCRALTKRRALRIAEAIRQANPHHIHASVLAEFRTRLEAIEL